LMQIALKPNSILKVVLRIVEVEKAKD